eukprot:scaffold9832_cov116-Isochrysis_galbana.AAC.1
MYGADQGFDELSDADPLDEAMEASARTCDAPTAPTDEGDPSPEVQETTGPATQAAAARASSPELDEARQKAADAIQPGWKVMSLASWAPGKHKPRKEHLLRAILRRNADVRASHWPAQKCVDWLSENGPGSSPEA